MAKKTQTFSIREVLERLDLEDNDDLDGSGDDVDESDDFDVGESMLTCENDDDDRAEQEAAISEADEFDAVQPWSCPDFVWRPAEHQQPVLHPFTGRPGIKVETSTFTPIDYFQLFMTDDLFNHFVIQTNLFADQYIASQLNLGPYSNVRQWVPTNITEMKKFLGLLFIMGVIRKPSISLYWSTDPLYQTPLFGVIMPRNRFQLLLKFFHVNNNDHAPNNNDPDRDRLFKVRPLLDELFEKFQTIYTPGSNVSVDESLLLWKGRLLFKQYLPLKRARFGVKLFCLCEDSGYMYRFRVYTGKQDPTTAIDIALPQECANLSKSEKIVVYLMMPLLGEGRSVWMDNWYTSCRLYDYLYHQKTHACGTVRSNRVPKQIKDVKLQVGAISSLRCGPMLCMKYRDKKDVFMMTTQHDESVVPAPKGRGRASKNRAITKPLCITEYNTNMGAVDKHDQMLQPYSIARKTMKWYKKLTFHLIHVALLNSYILYRKDGHDGTFLTFQHDVAASFLFQGKPTSEKAENSENLRRLTERHFPDILQPTPTWTKPQARCRVCSKKGIRRDVKTYCPTCPSKPGLCAVPCFRLWHEKLNYWD